MLSKEEVKHIANLARLGLTEEEIEKFQKDLSSILGYIEKLKEVNIHNVEPASHAVSLENVMRKDEIRFGEKSSDEAEKIMSLAPEKRDGFLKVKSILK